MRRLLVSLVALVALATALVIRPLAPAGLESHPAPVAGYAEALALLDSLGATDGSEIAPECRTGVYTHGAPTARVVVLLHGLTNCPAQFDSLARLLFAGGANVVVPRLPRHGRADRMTDELARLDAHELRALTDRVIDAAHGLGDTLTVAGLSTGGVMTAWAAQERADVHRAVVIAPMLGWARAPGPRATATLARLGSILPNLFIWWDDEVEQDLPGPKHVYPRFATRSVAATMLMGGAVTASAARRAPACRSCVMITVGGDIAADNAACAALVRAWRAHGAREVLTYEFADSLHLNHDVVDPEQVGGNPALTYPVLASYLAP